MPPFATATVPVTFAALPLIFPDTSEPGTVDDAVNADVPLPLTYPVKVVAPVPPYGTVTVLPFQVPLVSVPTVVRLLEPASGEAPMELYEMVLAAEPLYVDPDASPAPLLLIVSALTTLPAEPVVFWFSVGTSPA